MDLTLDVENYKLNVRAGGMIVHNNKILAHKNINKEHYCLPGGRVKIGENSENTIKRELKEELGKEIKIEEYLTTIENFFEMEGKKYHEIYFVYKFDFKDDIDKNIETTLKNMEGKDYLQYVWIDLNEVEKYNIVPKCLKEMLKMKNIPKHIINVN